MDRKLTTYGLTSQSGPRQLSELDCDPKSPLRWQCSPKRRRHKGNPSLVARQLFATHSSAFLAVCCLLPTVFISSVTSFSTSSSESLSSSYSFHRPTPLSPDYRPECDLIFPASKGKSSFQSSPSSVSSSTSAFAFGPSYFNQLDQSPSGDLLSSNELSSFYHKTSSSSSSIDQYLSSFSPRFVHCCTCMAFLSLLICQFE